MIALNPKAIELLVIAIFKLNWWKNGSFLARFDHFMFKFGHFLAISGQFRWKERYLSKTSFLPIFCLDKCNSKTECYCQNSKISFLWTALMHSHIAYIFLLFSTSFKNVPSNCLLETSQSHIGCICTAFLHCVFSNVFSNYLPDKMHSHIGYICLTFLHCAFFKTLLKLNGWEHVKLHWLHLFEFSPLCIFKCFSNWPAWDEA